MIKKIFLSLIVCPIITGCLSEQKFNQVTYYDLGEIEKVNIGKIFIEVGPLRASGISNKKMIYRKAKNELLIADYQQWVIFPKDMIRKYLQISFSGVSSQEASSKFYITGELLSLESDSTHATMAFNYTIKNENMTKSLSKIVNLKTKIDKNKNYLGQTQNMKDLVDEIKKSIKSMNE